MNSVFGAFKLLQLLSRIVSEPAAAQLNIPDRCAESMVRPLLLFKLSSDLFLFHLNFP